MAETVPVPSCDPAPLSAGATFGGGEIEGLNPVVIAAGLVMLALYRWAEEAARNAEEKHLRAERLAAYKVRHRWKTSDMRPLLTIGVSPPAQRRMAVLRGKGRPVVKKHRPWEDMLCDRLATWCKLLREDSTPIERRRAFRAWPWWKHHVEALYRGELLQARASGVKGPHDHAERVVADALRMSQGAVHMICGEIRAERREDPESANFPPMVLAEYERWMEHGVLPDFKE